MRPRRHSGLRPRRRPRHKASTKRTVCLVDVVAVQIYLTPQNCADAVAQLLSPTGRALSLPGLLCVVGTAAVQRCRLHPSDTKADRVESVAFHVHRALRRRTQTLVILWVRFFSRATILKKKKKRRSPTMKCLPTHAPNCASSATTLERRASAFFFVRQMWPQPWLAASLIGVCGSRFFGATHYGISSRHHASVQSLRYWPQTSLLKLEM